jgi:hypothetical protein
MCPDGDHDGLVAREYLFICLWPTEPVLRTRGSSRAAMSQMVGAGATEARGGPEVVWSREVGAEVTGTRGSPGVAPSREVGALILT